MDLRVKSVLWFYKADPMPVCRLMTTKWRWPEKSRLAARAPRLPRLTKPMSLTLTCQEQVRRVGTSNCQSSFIVGLMFEPVTNSCIVYLQIRINVLYDLCFVRLSFQHLRKKISYQMSIRSNVKSTSMNQQIWAKSFRYYIAKWNIYKNQKHLYQQELDRSLSKTEKCGTRVS